MGGSPRFDPFLLYECSAENQEEAADAGVNDRELQPFNPMLGETFEYARPDKGFRYVS
jgi:hypothetical protein